MGHTVRGSARGRARRATWAALVVAVAFAIPMMGAVPATAGVSKSERTLLRGLATNEAKLLKIHHPSFQTVLTTYAKYIKAFPGGPALNFGRVYVVQIVGKYSQAGKTFKAFELIVNAATNKEVAGIRSTTVKGLGKIGNVIKL
jgi:hypothetical protein